MTRDDLVVGGTILEFFAVSTASLIACGHAFPGMHVWQSGITTEAIIGTAVMASVTTDGSPARAEMTRAADGEMHLAVHVPQVPAPEDGYLEVWIRDEAASRIRMEIDSKPEELDRLDRRLIQLKIEREALKKEDDEATKKRLAKLEDDIAKLEKEYSDLEEIWKSEKAEVQGSAQIQQKIEQAKADWKAGRFGAVPDDAEFIPLPER